MKSLSTYTYNCKTTQMSAIEGKLILDALDEIEEPARFVDIVDYIRDKNDCPISVTTIEKTVQNALDAGVRYGFIQQDAGFYYSEAQIIKKMNASDSENEENLEDNEVHIFKTLSNRDYKNYKKYNAKKEDCTFRDLCDCNDWPTETLDVTVETDEIKDYSNLNTSNSNHKNSISETSIVTSTNSKVQQPLEEWGPPEIKKSRMCQISKQSLAAVDKETMSTNLEHISSDSQEGEELCVECGRCKSSNKSRKRRARGKSRKRGCGCR